MTSSSVRKAVIYAVWQDRLLVFRQPDFPEAGIQVPAGTVDPGEDVQAGARREFLEETGLKAASPMRLVGQRVATEEGRQCERHFFLLALEGAFPERWSWVEETPCDGRPPALFELFWHDLSSGLPELAGPLGAFLSSIRVPTT